MHPDMQKIRQKIFFVQTSEDTGIIQWADLGEAEEDGDTTNKEGAMQRTNFYIVYV